MFIGVCLHQATKWADYIYVYDGGWLPVFAPEEPFLRGRKVASIRKRMPGRKTQWNPAECAYTCSRVAFGCEGKCCRVPNREYLAKPQ
jgi:hypothetical protein